MDRKIVLDTETTGLDYLLSDRIIEIGAVELIDNHIIGKEFQVFINPGKELTKDSINIHGITNQDLEGKPSFQAIYKPFVNFIGDSTIIAHNAEFDRRIINLELSILGYPTLPQERFIDSLFLAKILFKGERVSLDYLCEKFNIDTSSRVKHGALIDSKLLAKLYIEMHKYIKGDKNISEYVSQILNYNQFTSHVTPKKTVGGVSFRSLALSKEEELKHNSFLKDKIPNSIWAKEI